MTSEELKPRTEVWWTEINGHGARSERCGRFVQIDARTGQALIATQGYENALYGIEPARLRRAR